MKAIFGVFPHAIAVWTTGGIVQVTGRGVLTILATLKLYMRRKVVKSSGAALAGQSRALAILSFTVFLTGLVLLLLLANGWKM